MKVALFITCFNDTLFPHVGIATTHLLERLGLFVDFPEAQTCCGQMHYNTGYQREAIPLLRHFVEVFRDADVIVAPSASCVGMVRDLYPKAAALSGERTLIEAVEQLIPRVLHVGDAPLLLLHDVKGIDLVELPNARECCGFGGTFAIKNVDTSLAMLSDKTRCVLDTGAEVLCSADTSCLLHIGGGLHRQRAGVTTIHLAEILASTESEAQ